MITQKCIAGHLDLSQPRVQEVLKRFNFQLDGALSLRIEGEEGAGLNSELAKIYQ